MGNLFSQNKSADVQQNNVVVDVKLPNGVQHAGSLSSDGHGNSYTFRQDQGHLKSGAVNMKGNGNSFNFGL